jgi:hypothetical protein
MELFAEGLSVMGAMVLSVSCGLLLEELLFGGLVRLFFRRVSPGVRRPHQQPETRFRHPITPTSGMPGDPGS